MTAERDLARLRGGMSPSVRHEPYVYCLVTGGLVPPDVRPLATFRELEGLTLILSRREARAAGLASQFECAWVTLGIHSALEAVGFIALISGVLAEAGIPCNVVSAYHHDHLFVPFRQRHRAMRLLNELAAAR